MDVVQARSKEFRKEIVACHQSFEYLEIALITNYVFLHLIKNWGIDSAPLKWP